MVANLKANKQNKQTNKHNRTQQHTFKCKTSSTNKNSFCASSKRSTGL